MQNIFFKKSINKPFIIAEIGQAHEGSFGLAHSFIDSIADAGADAVKFQCHLSEFESSSYDKFRIKSEYMQDKTRLDYWKRMEFTLDQWISLKKHAEKKGLIFLCSPFSTQAVDILNKINIELFKIGSGEVFNYEFINYIAKFKKPIILSSGLVNSYELNKSIKIIEKHHKKIAILYCVSKYPSSPEDIDINNITILKKKFPKYTIGYSDHTGSIYPSIASLSLGSKIIEVHVTYDRNMFGFDSTSSINFEELKELVKANNITHKLLTINKNNKNNNSSMKKLFGRSYFLKEDIKENQIILDKHLILKKPAIGIKQDEKKKILGRRVRKNLKKGSLLSTKDLF